MCWGWGLGDFTTKTADGRFAETRFWGFVGNSSATENPQSCFVIASLGICHLESGSHNPEVVGSNPAPATRRKDLEPCGSESFLLIFPVFAVAGSIGTKTD